MKLLLTVCLLLSGTVSQASTTPAPLTRLENGVSPVIATVTPNARESAKYKKAKIQLLPKRAQRVLAKSTAPGSFEVPDGTDSDDVDLQTAYRRPRIVTDESDALPDGIQSRLDQARKLALAKYRETWT